MIKFLQRVGHNFRTSFKEGYHAPMPEGGHGGVVGLMGTVIVGAPLVVAYELVRGLLTKKSSHTAVADVAMPQIAAAEAPSEFATTKSWAAAEQAKSEAAGTQLTR